MKLNPIKTEKPDGGPAFPTKSYSIEREVMTHEEGMTLRDYFAAVAMAKFAWREIGDDAMHAKECYAIADAMLEARK